MMTEKRFERWNDHSCKVKDNQEDTVLNWEDVVDKLNEQESTITSLKERNKQLRRRLEKINGGYGHLTHRNGLTANEWVIERQEKELRKKNEQISDWIERHSKDIVKIGEQQATISALKEENEQLRKENKDLNDMEWEKFKKKYHLE